MNIQTVKNNLAKTIRGKELALDEYREARKVASWAEDHALYAIVEFLELNLTELRAILADLEKYSATPECTG